MADRVDYEGTAAAYRAARTLPDDVLHAWESAVTSIGIPPGGVTVDIGAGTGQFADPLAAWLSGRVLGVEPSGAMRAEAEAAGITARHPFVAARAELLPIAAGAAGAAWLSTVVHQIADLAAAVGELRRVLAPGGTVLVRGFFGDQPPTGLWARFPGSARAAATFPTTASIVSTFEREGFTHRTTLEVVETWRFDLDTWVQRANSVRHTDSALRPLTDREFSGGIDAIREAFAGEPGPIESETVLRLVTFDC